MSPHPRRRRSVPASTPTPEAVSVASVVTPSPPPQFIDPRERLREFAAYLEGRDPLDIANRAECIEATLVICGRLKSWFAEYETALRVRAASRLQR